MDWDEDYGDEFISFKDGTQADMTIYSPNRKVLYLEPNWSTLTEYINQWNKTRRKMKVFEILPHFKSPLAYDEIKTLDNIWLDMGARLYKAVLPFAKKGTKYIRIIKDANPIDKFDTWYTVFIYKPTHQKTLPKKKTGK